MSQLTVDQALQLALQHQGAREFDQAEELYRQIIAAYPDQADAFHLLGSLYLQQKKYDLAEARLRQALLIRKEPAFALTLGLALQSTNRHADAVELLQKLAADHPDFIEGHVHLGVCLSVLGRFEEAARAFQNAIDLNPNHIQAQGNLGIVLCHLGRYDEALWLLRTAVNRAPKSADFRASLAAALYGTGQLDAALLEVQQAVTLNPRHAHGQNLLGIILRMLNRSKEAIDPARIAAELMPDFSEVQVNYGETLRSAGQLDDAAAHYRATMARGLKGNDLHNNLGNTLKDQGLLDDAILEYKQSLSMVLSPAVFSNLIYTMHYHQDYTPGEMFQELDRYRRMVGEPLKSEIQPHTNDKTPARRLRIGYISSEFRQHALGLNLIPLFTRHDKSAFEIFIYAHVDKPDFYTFRFRQLADHWKDVHHKSDYALAQMIRDDKIDILIDLHQHMAANRLPVYAMQPAPVQIAFAGYPGSTGLDTIGWRLTDPFLEPEIAPPYPSSEKILRLPSSFWCYHPVTEVPVNDLPALKNGHITFGNLNNFCKLNPRTYDLWIQVLQAVPNSRLLLLTPEGTTRDRVRNYFSRHGIPAERIDFVNRAGASEYYRYYQRIDICLDSFPCNGHTTSMDAWFMGVPVTSIQGNTLFGRATWSQANNLALTDLVGNTEQDFVKISVALAQDLDRLATLRKTLRDRMKNSPLMNDQQFAAGIESAYKQAWQSWCESGTS